MNWLESKMKWIMLVSGLLTLTMVYPALAPQAALRSMFGESIEGTHMRARWVLLGGTLAATFDIIFALFSTGSAESRRCGFCNQSRAACLAHRLTQVARRPRLSDSCSIF